MTHPTDPFSLLPAWTSHRGRFSRGPFPQMCHFSGGGGGLARIPHELSH